ncbi:hypothetical protein Q8F55_000858 [Vanrija albida]|uniref:Uncharacterized protein n=1 Tax=Vanrija albida TaxID=181172 RepID=A0ABR3QEI2_9TREE
MYCMALDSQQPQAASVALEQSLAEECTPLKQRYDGCFNLWFEGYLQPALDSASLASRRELELSSLSSAPTATPEPSPSSAAAPAPAPAPTPAPFHLPPQAARHATSWGLSSAFRARPAPVPTPAAAQSPADDMVSAAHVHHAPDEREPLDTSGMSRAQAKAAEYERHCGAAWRAYQGCLRKAISANPNLTTLLDQAREEHPLHTMDGLEGTAWDPNNKGTAD